jgi:hypothetical protein
MSQLAPGGTNTLPCSRRREEAQTSRAPPRTVTDLPPPFGSFASFEIRHLKFRDLVIGFSLGIGHLNLDIPRPAGQSPMATRSIAGFVEWSGVQPSRKQSRIMKTIIRIISGIILLGAIGCESEHHHDYDGRGGYYDGYYQGYGRDYRGYPAAPGYRGYPGPEYRPAPGYRTYP